MGISLNQDEVVATMVLEQNCSKHISVVNDIYSYEKEFEASRMGHVEGGALCSAVQVLGQEIGVPIPAAKRILWYMCREWEVEHVKIVEELRGKRGANCKDLWSYVEGVQYQMSGNEVWSASTKRYHA